MKAKTVANILTLVFTFLLNLLIMGSAVSVYASIFRIRMGAETLARLNIAPTQDNLIAFWAITLVLVPAILGQFDIVQLFLTIAENVSREVTKEYIIAEQALFLVCANAGLELEDYRIFISDEDCLNAYAIGKKNIIVTKRLVNELSISDLTGILAHEMGHLENQDYVVTTGTYMMGMCGRWFIALCRWATLILAIFSLIPFVGLFAAFLVYFIHFMIWIVECILQFPVTLVHMFGSREAEYDADRYACEIGLGGQLRRGLLYITRGEKKLSFGASLISTHPDTGKRVEKINKFYADRFNKTICQHVN